MSLQDLSSWQSRAACRGMGLELFFGADGEREGAARYAREAEAKRICARCPVAEICLEDAMDRHDWHASVWGGLNGDERRAEHRRRQRQALKEKAA